MIYITDELLLLNFVTFDSICILKKKILFVRGCLNLSFLSLLKSFWLDVTIVLLGKLESVLLYGRSTLVAVVLKVLF